MNLDKRIDGLLGPNSPVNPKVRKRIKEIVGEAIDYCTPKRSDPMTTDDPELSSALNSQIEDIQAKKQELGYEN